jgi:hypothetical protein
MDLIRFELVDSPVFLGGGGEKKPPPPKNSTVTYRVKPYGHYLVFSSLDPLIVYVQGQTVRYSFSSSTG